MKWRTFLKIIYICFVKKYKIFFACLFSFGLGCGITLQFLRAQSDDFSRYHNDYYSESLVKVENSRNFDHITEYAVLILTAIDHVDQRAAIRHTWKKFIHNFQIIDKEKVYKWNPGGFSSKNDHHFIKFYFVVGIKGLDKSEAINLYDEKINHNDMIILENYVDEYKTLSTKMLHSIKWINEHLNNVKYVIKCDDDSFVRIDLIVKELEEFAPKMNALELEEFVSYKPQKQQIKGLYWGYFDGRAKIVTKGKWQENKWFLCNRYLPYALGGGYVLSRSIVDFVAKNVDYLSTYNSEDVSMGVWTASLDRINRVHDIRFDTEWKSRGCNDQMLIRHKQNPEDMYLLYKVIVQSHGEKLCTHLTAPDATHMEYRYNWNVLPNSCCGRR